MDIYFNFKFKKYFIVYNNIWLYNIQLNIYINKGYLSHGHIYHNYIVI